MAMITLNQVWLNRLSDGALVVHAYSSDRGRGTGMAGEVRQFAGGRQRPIVREGVRGTFTFKLRDLTDDDIESVKENYGVPVCVRDHRGRVYFGIYFASEETERKDKELWDLSINVQEITYEVGA